MNRLHFLPDHRLNDAIAVVALNLLIELLPRSNYAPELKERVRSQAQAMLDFLNGKPSPSAPSPWSDTWNHD